MKRFLVSACLLAAIAAACSIASLPHGYADPRIMGERTGGGGNGDDPRIMGEQTGGGSGDDPRVMNERNGSGTHD